MALHETHVRVADEQILAIRDATVFVKRAGALLRLAGNTSTMPAHDKGFIDCMLNLTQGFINTMLSKLERNAELRKLAARKEVDKILRHRTSNRVRYHALRASARTRAGVELLAASGPLAIEAGSPGEPVQAEIDAGLEADLIEIEGKEKKADGEEDLTWTEAEASNANASSPEVPTSSSSPSSCDRPLKRRRHD